MQKNTWIHAADALPTWMSCSDGGKAADALRLAATAEANSYCSEKVRSAGLDTEKSPGCFLCICWVVSRDGVISEAPCGWDALSVELIAAAKAIASSGLGGATAIRWTDAALGNSIPNLGLLAFNQLGPNTAPFIGKHLFPRDNASSKAFNIRGALSSDGPVSTSHLREVGCGNLQGFSQGCCLATFGLDIGFKLHSFLAFAKVYSAFAKEANAKVSP